MNKPSATIYKRPPVIPAPAITPRDINLFQTLSTTVYLTTPQIQTLFWPDERSNGGKHGLLKACQERLRRLTAHGYTRRVTPFVRQGDPPNPYIYALNKRGAHRLAEETGVDTATIRWKPTSAEENPSYLRHFLTMVEMRIAFSLAGTRHNVSIIDWFDDKELKSNDMKDYVTITSPRGVNQRAAVVPDACVTLRQQEKAATFFVELDLATVTIRPSLWEKRGWTRKVNAYQAYLGSDVCCQRYGTPDVQVLTITTTDKRREHLQEATEQVGAGMDFWFTTLDKARNPDKLLTHPIWHRVGVKKQCPLLN